MLLTYIDFLLFSVWLLLLFTQHTWHCRSWRVFIIILSPPSSIWNADNPLRAVQNFVENRKHRTQILRSDYSPTAADAAALCSFWQFQTYTLCDKFKHFSIRSFHTLNHSNIIIIIIVALSFLSIFYCNEFECDGILQIRQLFRDYRYCRFLVRSLTSSISLSCVWGAKPSIY